ncbi:MAG: protoporphyrinogen oxidase [Gemmatimonadota bacterium]
MIAVVGGGITGLTLGWELARRGADFVVLEGSTRPGGVIRSAEVEGRILDWGPQRARLTKGVTRLVREVGLEEQVVEAPRGLDLFVYRQGRLRKVPFSARDFAGSDIVSLGAKLRLALEPFTAGADPDERVAGYFTRKVGRELYETLIAPLYGGLYGSDPADMRVGLSLIHVLREFNVRRSLVLPLLGRGGKVDPPPACTFREGMHALPRAVAATLGDRLRLETPVRALRPDGSGWRVELEDEALEADAVVLSVPAPVASRLLADVAPEEARAVGSLRYNPLAVVHLDAETELKGLGFQVAFTEPALQLRGVTYNDALFGRKNLYTAYLGGARHPEVAGMGADALAARAVEEFRLCTGYDARPLAVEHERMPAWDTSWSAIEGLSLPGGLHVAANWWSRPGLPGRLAEAARLAGALTGQGRDGPPHA